MKKTVFFLLVTFVCAAPAFSQMMDRPMMGLGEGYGRMAGLGYMDRMGDQMGMCLEQADKLGLTDEQLKKITPIHREMKKKQIRFNADLRIAEMEHVEIMEVKDFDLEKASASVKKVADMKTAHRLDMLKTMKEVRSILTEEQFQKMKKLMPLKKGARKPARQMKR